MKIVCQSCKMLGLIRVFGFLFLILSLAAGVDNNTAAQNQQGQNRPAANQPVVNQPAQPIVVQPGQPVNQSQQPELRRLRERELERANQSQPVVPVIPVRPINQQQGGNQQNQTQPAQPVVILPAGSQPVDQIQSEDDVREDQDLDLEDLDEDLERSFDFKDWDFNITRFLTKELNKTLFHLFKMCKKLHKNITDRSDALSDKPEGERSLLMGMDWLCQLNFNATAKFMGLQGIDLGKDKKAAESAGGVYKKNVTQDKSQSTERNAEIEERQGDVEERQGDVEETISVFHRRKGCDRGCRRQCRRHWQGFHRRRTCWCNCRGRRTASWEA